MTSDIVNVEGVGTGEVDDAVSSSVGWRGKCRRLSGYFDVYQSAREAIRIAMVTERTVSNRNPKEVVRTLKNPKFRRTVIVKAMTPN